jgi:hypothetical protein
MTRQVEKKVKMFDGKVFGFKVSDYAVWNGYLDYHTLSKMVGDMVLNNNIYEYAGYENWELATGAEEDEEGNYFEVYQYYIISDYGARILEDYTDEIVYYHEELDLYLWGITHFGTAWDYVLTDVMLIEM